MSSNSSSSLSSTSSKVFSTSSSHSRLIHRDHSTIGVSDQVGVQVKRTRVSNGGNHRGSMSNNSSSSLSSTNSKVFSTSSSNSSLIHRDHSTIGVLNQVGVQVKRTRVTEGGNHRGSMSNSSRSSLSSTSSKVFSTSSSNGSLIHRDHSTIGVLNQVGVQVKRTRVTEGGNHRGSMSNSSRSSLSSTSSK